MALKIENQSTIDLPKGAEDTIHNIISSIPSEHLRGLEKIRLVDFIKDPRLKNVNLSVKGDMPGLYHPKMGQQNAWLEVATGAILKPLGSFMERWMAKSQFKGNMAGILFSLVGQHYFLTLRHSVKKTNLEPQIRQYAEKYLKAWGEKQSANSWRGKLFKPLRPFMERLARWLNKKTLQAQKAGK